MTRRADPDGARALPLLALAAFGLTVALVLHRWAGTAPLPPTRSLSGLRQWWADQGPVVAAIAVGRVAAIVAAWYLVAVGSVGALAARSRLRTVERLARLLVPASARGVLAGIAGTGVVLSVSPVGTLVAPPVLAGAAAADPSSDPAAGVAAGTAVLTELGPGEVVPAGPSVSASDPGVPLASGSEAGPPAVPEAQGEPAEGASATAAEDATWFVDPGDSFWSIASETVAERLGRPASDDEITGYWRGLVDTNRDRLADPDNPDLLFRGQEIVLP